MWRKARLKSLERGSSSKKLDYYIQYQVDRRGDTWHVSPTCGEVQVKKEQELSSSSDCTIDITSAIIYSSH